MSVIVTDTNGQLWVITVNPDGSITTTPTSGTTPTPITPATDSSITLQSVVNLCSTHVDLMPLANVGGYTQEPALSLANDTLQELLAAPYDWKFNRKSSGLLVTQPARQDYLFGGASAFVLGIGGVSIGLATASAISEDVSGNVTVVCMQQHNFRVGQTVYMTGNTIDAYNSSYLQSPTLSGWSGGWAITATPDLYTFEFVHTTTGLDVSGAAGIFDCSWLESATMYDTSATDPNPRQWEVSAVKSLKRSSQPGRPEKIALVSQRNGVLTLRITEVPNFTIYGLTIDYQMKPQIKTDLSQSWAPFPDEFSFVYRQSFLARCYRFLDHRRADAEEQRTLAMIAKALDKDDVEESDQYVTPERSIMEGLW